MQKTLILVCIALFTSGCTHREYIKVHTGGSGSLDIDKAECRLRAENNVPNVYSSINPYNSYYPIVINLNDNSNLSKKEREQRDAAKMHARQQLAWERDRKVDELTDLCLKTKGWSWREVKD